MQQIPKHVIHFNMLMLVCAANPISTQYPETSECPIGVSFRLKNGVHE